MKPKFISKIPYKQMLALALIAQLSAVAVNAQSSRARERANDNARFNRENDSNSNRRITSDDEFLRNAYSRAVGEENLAQLAVKNSQDAEIQKIGHRMINEQNRAKADLKRIAEAKNITLQNELAQADQRTRDRLSGLQGAEFDRAYRDHLNTDYKNMIYMYQDQAQDARDTQVRDVASQYAKMFEEHAKLMGVTGVGVVDTDRRNRDRDRGYVRDRDNASTAPAAATGRLSQKDEDLLQRVYRMNKVEIEAGRLAEKRGGANKSKVLAQTMISDHQQMERDLEEIASRRKLDLPKQLGSGQEDNLANLKKLSGNDFDKEYNDYLARSHRNAEKLLKDAASSSDPDVRNFASKYLGSIRQHEQSIQRNQK